MFDFSPIYQNLRLPSWYTQSEFARVLSSIAIRIKEFALPILKKITDSYRSVNEFCHHQNLKNFALVSGLSFLVIISLSIIRLRYSKKVETKV